VLENGRVIPVNGNILSAVICMKKDPYNYNRFLDLLMWRIERLSFMYFSYKAKTPNENNKKPPILWLRCRPVKREKRVIIRL